MLALKAVSRVMHSLSEETLAFHPSLSDGGVARRLVACAVVLAAVMSACGAQTTAVAPTSGVPPTPRIGASVVYDEAQARMVLFGGGVSAPLHNDTWTWDGRTWTQQHPSVSPPGRQQAVFVYDAAHRVSVLFGGMGFGSGTHPVPIALADTWTWNGRTWSSQHPQHSPQLTFNWPASMGFDPVTRNVILYGFGTDYKPQTWSWNGSNWSELNPPDSPASSGTMFSDGRRLFVVAPPFQPVGGRYLNQTWRWEGGDWKLLSLRNDMPEPGVFAAAYDKKHGQLIAYDGDTWSFDGVGWTRLHPLTRPPGFGYTVYFGSRQQVVSWGDMFGSPNNDMWAWDGSNWTLVQKGTASPKPTPSGKGMQTLTGAMPADAEAFIRANVTAVSPVLVPAWLPAGMEAMVDAGTDSFSVIYRSDQRDKRIDFGIIVANPPPPGPNAGGGPRSFRRTTAQYQVYDANGPLSSRWLMWGEGGSLKSGGVPYFLSAEGLTDAEFWQVANSLR